MSSERYVPTADIKRAVKGREAVVFKAEGIPWPPENGATHIRCPYPTHGGENDWRYDACKGIVLCSCTEGQPKPDTVLDVVAKVRGLSLEEAKLRVAETLGEHRLIRTRQDGSRGQKQDPASLLNPPAEQRQDSLVAAYLAHRLRVAEAEVSLPATPAVGWRSLGYFDPPKGKAEKPVHVGDYPAAVFGTIRLDGRRHAHRIFLAEGGRGKADLPGGRKPKKSAQKRATESTAGCSVFWGDYETAEELTLAEGVETACAVAYAYRSEIAAGRLAVAATICTAGLRAFQPPPNVKRITIAADRDEDPKGKDNPTRAGETAARAFAAKQAKTIAVRIALPGQAGESVDWLDVHVERGGAAAVRAGLEAASLYEPDSAEAALAKVEAEYPLPDVGSPELTYGFWRDGSIWMQKAAGRDGQPTPVASPFAVLGWLRYVGATEAYGLRVVVQGLGGAKHEIDLPRHLLGGSGGSEIKRILFDHGLRTMGDGDQLAVACLKAAHPTREILVLRKPGWHRIAGVPDLVFACPDGEVIGAPEGLALELSIHARVPAPVARGGTYEGWLAAVEAALQAENAPHWQIGLACGLAGVLIGLLTLPNGALGLHGPSSLGKTLAQRLAASVWTIPDSRVPESLLVSAKTTTNAVEHVAAKASGTVLVLDELGHISGAEVARLIYTLASGVGKRRMTPDAQPREAVTWETFTLLSGEISLREKIEKDDGTWTSGMPVRVPDVDVEGVNARVPSGTLRAIDGVRLHYGWLGPRFVKALVADDMREKVGMLRSLVHQLADDLAGPEAAGDVRRAALPFGVLALAGELAVDYGLLPASFDATGAVQWAWARFRQSNAAETFHPGEQVKVNLQARIAEKWDSEIQRIERSPDHRPSRNALGWYDETTVFISRRHLRELTGVELSELAIAKLLDETGSIAARVNARSRHVTYVRGVGNVQAYAIPRSVFGRPAHLHAVAAAE